MEIEKSTKDKSKLILVVAVIILVGALFGTMGYLLGSKNNNTIIKSEEQFVKDQGIDNNRETEKDENIKEDVSIDIKDEKENWKIHTNDKYGFEVTLLDSWKGYEVLTESWKGISLNGDSKQYQGPQIIIRNPKWSVSKPWQDIPIMVFTKDEWELIEAKNLSVNAAPIGPNKLDENQEYVFALPPRWIGFTDNLKQDEAQEISKTIKAISVTTEDEMANWNVYENKEFGFEIKCPESIEHYPKTWGIDFVEKSKTQNKFFTICLYSEVGQLPNNETGLAFEDWINKQIENKTFEDGRIFKNDTLTGIKVRDNGIVPFKNILIRNNNKIYSFVIRENSQLMDMFDQIISTFKFTN